MLLRGYFIPIIYRTNFSLLKARTHAIRFIMAGMAALLVFARSAECQLISTSFDARSAAFEIPFEEKAAHSFEHFRADDLKSLSAEELARMQLVGRNDDRLEEPLLSLDLFRSLAAYDREAPFASQSIIDGVLPNALTDGRVAPNAALMGALEFYAHAPLSRNDVEAGLARLNEIGSKPVADSLIAAEIHFWKAEGYCALGEFVPAEAEYRNAIARPSDRRFKALNDFRLGELLDREARYPESAFCFLRSAQTRESPLMLLSLLRLGSVMRSEKNYPDVLATMDEADSLYRATQHLVRTSARDVQYHSGFLEVLLEPSLGHERVVGLAPLDSSVMVEPVPQLVSPYYQSEVALLRGSALTELGRYEESTEVLTKGEELISAGSDSMRGTSFAEQARFISDALRFERGWSLFQRGKYQEASAAFLELAVTDTGRSRYGMFRTTTLPLREQGLYFDPFLNDSLSATTSIAQNAPTIAQSVLAKNSVDTSFFIYNDFPERARYYAGVALARAGMLSEAAEALQKLTLDRSMLYSDKAVYQLALIRFVQHSYEASKLLEPVSSEKNVRGGYASFLLGELAYRRDDYERAEEYFLNAFANLPQEDTAIRATAHLERGLSLIPLNNWSDAAQELAAYFDHSHEHVAGRTDEALFWLGRAYFRAGEYDSARVIFSRLRSEYPGSSRTTDAQYSYAWSLFAANDYQHAEPAFQQIVTMDSISRYAYDALAHAGDSYYALGEIKRANTLYNLATDRPGFNPLRATRALLMLGVTRMRIDSERSAMNEFEYLIRKFPQCDIVDLASFDYVLSAYAINQNESAETMVSSIVSKYPRSALAPRALYVAGEERVRRGDEKGSLHYYERVVNRYARSKEAGPALFALQDALVDLKQIPEALVVADSFVARNPQNPINPEVLLRGGELQMKLREPARALFTFRSFLRQYPSRPEMPRAELLVAEAELATGDTSRSIQQFDSVIARYDSLDIASEAYLGRARIQHLRKNFDGAANDFERAFQDRYYSSDAAPEAMYEYGRQLSERKKIDSAEHMFLALSVRYPIEASIGARGALRAGELLEAERKPDSALAVFAHVIATHPTDGLGGEAMFHNGEIEFEHGAWMNAIETLTAARENFPLSPELDQRSLFAIARAEVHLARKLEAVRSLRKLLEIRSLPEHERESAKSLLDTLLPPAKKKHKKGGKG